jgi:Ig-like domain CHU_C associated/Secretion system C-terminal sorting domain
MKKIYFFFSILLCSLVTIAQTQMNVPVTFDDPTVNYGLVGFGGAEQATIVTDPTLATNKVGKVIKTNTAELWAGVSVTALAGTVQTSFANNIPFTATERRMNVRVWSPHAGIQVRLKVEDKNDPTKTCETEATITTANGWQTLVFNFANQAAGTAPFNLANNFNKASIFFNFGVTGATAGERIYYFDDVKFGPAAGATNLPILPLDFESATINYTFTDFNGGGTTKIANPQINGINTSATVAKMIKSAGEVYGGSLLELAAPIDFSVNKTFKVKVFSPRVGAKLLLKVESTSNGALNFEREATSTVANAWEELTFDYSAVSTTSPFDKLVFIFDLGTVGNGTANFTWLFDDVRLVASTGGGLTQMNVPVTFDDATVNYGLVGFGGAEQATIVVDPTLATNKVGKVIKTNTAELWAGVSVTALAGTVQTSFANAIPFTATERRMNVRVWSPHAGISIKLKVEDKNDPTKSCETDAALTVANGWQTLEFNFNNQSAGTSAFNAATTYNKVSIFFNFGVTGATAGERIYYFDDVKFGPATVTPPTLTQMNVPVTFDDPTVNYGLVGFGGAEQATVVVDPTLATNKVGKVIKTNTAELWAGVSVTALAGTVQTSFANAIPFTATERRMNVRVWSPHAGISIKLKVEDKNDPTKSCETDAALTVANGWQTLEFNFNNQSAGTSAFNAATTYNKVSIFFNFGVTGATAGERIYYFDDVKFGPATVTPPTLTQMNVPVTFDDPTVNYGLVGFGGAEQATIVVDPTLATNKVGKVIKTNTAELWAGVSVTALAGTVQTSFANAIPFTATERRMNVRVWSPHAGISIKLKVEDKNDPTKSCETDAMFTGAANTWQTLEFNFNNQSAGTSAFNAATTYNKVSIFFNFGVTGATAGERIYYFDDVKFGPATVTPPTLTQMNVPVTFDDPTVNYGLVGFGGAEQATIVTDPTLATNKVGKVIKTNTAELWAGVSVTALAGTVQTSFENAIPFTATERRMNVRVWSPHTGISIKLKVEDKNDPTKSCETDAMFTGAANTWQTLEFNFNNQSAGTSAFNAATTYNKVSIFFNFGVTGATAGERIYYFDDVKFGPATVTPPTLTQMNVPVTFDDPTVNYGLVGFGGAEQATIVTDPTLATNKVGKVIKTNTAELWAGVSVTALAGTVQTSFANAIPFTATERRMNVRVWSPHAGISIKLKVEDKNDPTKSCETDATLTVANGWQTLEFNFNNQSAGTSAFNAATTYNKVSIFFNFGVTGATAGERIYYFDDVKFGPATVTPPTLTQMNVPVTFDDPTVNYGLVGFGGAEQATIVTDPTLATNKVGKVIKTNTAELWAGVSVTALAGTVQTSFANAIPFTATERRMNVRVWSPHAGIQVRLKVEDKNDGTRSCETEATVTVASGWQTLEFNFNNQVAGTAAFNPAFTFNKASLFFNFGVTGAVAGERIYYFDDVKFGPATVTPPTNLPVLPIDFESATINYAFTDFNGGGTTKIANPQVNGINTSATVAKMVKSVGEVYGGSFLTLAGPINFTVNKVFKVKVFSPRIGAKLLLKVESTTNPAANFEREATSTVANAWEELTFDYTAVSTTSSFDKLVFIFDLGTVGNGTANFTWLFDDIRLITVAGGLSQMNVPVTFDDPTVNYGLFGFGGAEQSTIVTDPTLATNKVAKVIKTNTAELWAGTTITALIGSSQTAFANNIPFAAGATKMNVRVWSPHTGIQVRLKVEDKNDPTKSCETEATFTGAANTWQTLEFNFANQAAGTAALNVGYNLNKASIFFNFGVTGITAGERIYYFDDVKFGAIQAPVIPTAPTVVSPANFCVGSTVVLPVTASAGNTLLWYTVAAGGTSSTTAPVINTTTISTATYYVSQINAALLEGPRATIIVNVNATPIAPTAATAFTYCQNATAAILTATGAAGNTIKWHTSLTGVGSTTAITPSTLTAGTTNYYVSQTNSFGCESPKATIVVTINAAAAAPTTSAVNYCQNATAAPLTATAAAGNTLKWYTVATGGTVLAAGHTPSTTTVGTTTFYVSQVNAAGCESQRASLNVVVRIAPAMPSVTSPVAYCANAIAALLSATADAGNNLMWYNAATGGTGSVNTPSPSTTISGITTYYVAQSNAGGCESPRAAINVNIIATPIVGSITAAPYTRLYPGLTTSISIANSPAAGNVYAWYRNGILLSGQTGNSVNATIDALGNYTLKVTNANGCVGTSNVVNISDSAQQKMFVYPNPSNGRFQVRYLSDNNNLSPRKISIYNEAGTQVYTASFVMFAGYTAMNIDLKNVASGIYVIHLMDNNGKQLATERILIRR